MKPTKSICFAGLLAAIHVIASIFIRFAWVPGLEILFLFVAPFLSAMYAIKANWKYTLVYFIATIGICLGIDWAGAMMYVLPTLVVGILYGFLQKKKQNGTTIVYALTIAEFGLVLFGAWIIKLGLGKDYIETLQNFFPLEGNAVHLALGLILFYSFAQAFLIHIITKYELKRMKIDVVKTKYPAFWLFVLHIASLVCCFLPFKKEIYIFFTSVAAIVFGLPIALYGYQSCDKVWIILLVQVVVFLGGSIPLMRVFEGYKAVSAYIILFVPPLVWAFVSLFRKDYNKDQLVTPKKKTKKAK